MAEEQALRFKRATFEDSLGRFSEVRVAFVDHPDLVVPEGVRPPAGEARILSYGLDMPVPIPDLEITDVGISATLSFDRAPHKTFVPWEAVAGVRAYGGERSTEADGVERRGPKLTLVP